MDIHIDPQPCIDDNMLFELDVIGKLQTYVARGEINKKGEYVVTDNTDLPHGYRRHFPHGMELTAWLLYRTFSACAEEMGTLTANGCAAMSDIKTITRQVEPNGEWWVCINGLVYAVDCTEEDAIVRQQHLNNMSASALYSQLEWESRHLFMRRPQIDYVNILRSIRPT